MILCVLAGQATEYFVDNVTNGFYCSSTIRIEIYFEVILDFYHNAELSQRVDAEVFDDVGLAIEALIATELVTKQLPDFSEDGVGSHGRSPALTI